jgi:hypothetical protein
MRMFLFSEEILRRSVECAGNVPMSQFFGVPEPTRSDFIITARLTRGEMYFKCTWAFISGPDCLV